MLRHAQFGDCEVDSGIEELLAVAVEFLGEVDGLFVEGVDLFPFVAHLDQESLFSLHESQPITTLLTQVKLLQRPFLCTLDPVNRCSKLSTFQVSLCYQT